jgi:hypothetical protein
VGINRTGLLVAYTAAKLVCASAWAQETDDLVAADREGDLLHSGDVCVGLAKSGDAQDCVGHRCTVPAQPTRSSNRTVLRRNYTEFRCAVITATVRAVKVSYVRANCFRLCFLGLMEAPGRHSGCAPG